MTKIIIHPYSPTSRGANVILENVEGVVTSEQFLNQTFSQNESVFHLNWGMYTRHDDIPQHIINPRPLFQLSSNKVRFFNYCEVHNIPCPQYVVNRAPEGLLPVITRIGLGGERGRNAHYIETMEEFDHLVNENDISTQDILCTEYMPKDREYRILVTKKPYEENPTITIFRFKRRNNPTNLNTRIRNQGDGYYYSTVNLANVFSDVRRKVQHFVSTLDKTFSPHPYIYVADLIYNERLNKTLFLEVNTAPEMEGEPRTAILNFFTEITNDGN